MIVREVDLAERQLLAEDEREQQVERALERVEVQLELAHGDGHRRGGYWRYRTRPLGIAIVVRRLRRLAALRLLRGAAGGRSCSTKYATAATNTMMLTQAFSRRPAMWCAGSIRSSSSKKRPKQYQAT